MSVPVKWPAALQSSSAPWSAILLTLFLAILIKSFLSSFPKVRVASCSTSKSVTREADADNKSEEVPSSLRNELKAQAAERHLAEFQEAAKREITALRLQRDSAIRERDSALEERDHCLERLSIAIQELVALRVYTAPMPGNQQIISNTAVPIPKVHTTSQQHASSEQGMRDHGGIPASAMIQNNPVFIDVDDNCGAPPFWVNQVDTAMNLTLPHGDVGKGLPADTSSSAASQLSSYGTSNFSGQSLGPHQAAGAGSALKSSATVTLSGTLGAVEGTLGAVEGTTPSVPTAPPAVSSRGANTSPFRRAPVVRGRKVAEIIANCFGAASQS